ncbi:hypothetical protein C8J57DRAFT_1254919 [Mycena rebaudengoi]|nr:hypothetical protein C8J57DRAFT_1254919 [Mycena rebaudengoi]
MTGRKEVKGNAMRASRTHSWRRAEEAPQEGEGAVDWRDKLVLGENQDEGRGWRGKSEERRDERRHKTLEEGKNRRRKTPKEATTLTRARAAGGEGRMTRAGRADGDDAQDGAQSVRPGEHGLSGREEEDGIQGLRLERVRSGGVFKEPCRRSKGEGAGVLYYADISHYEKIKGKTNPSRHGQHATHPAEEAHTQPPKQSRRGNIIVGIVAVKNRPGLCMHEGVQRSVQDDCVCEAAAHDALGEGDTPSTHRMGGAKRVTSGIAMRG